MSWLTALQDLRIHLSDGPTDRIHYRKMCFGEVNGVNLRFKTFEFRRITDFTKTIGVFVDGVLLDQSAIAGDAVLTGEFILQTAPNDGSVVEASYYTQWFLDAELEDFLRQASRWLLSTSEYQNTNPGLIPCLTEYAASRAYKKMAQRWKEYLSSVYKVEDAPKDALAKTDDFNTMSDNAMKEALAMSKFFYTRQSQNLQPLFGVVVGNVRSMP